MSTVVPAPLETGAVVGLLGDGFALAKTFRLGGDGVWTDDDGYEHTWPEIEHAARVGGYTISRVEPAVTA